MLGERNDEGLIPRVCQALMTAPVLEGTVRTFKITYIEIFLEKVRDLLRGNGGSNGPAKEGNHHPKSLKVREHPTDGPFVEGAMSAEILTYTECMNLMDIGSRNRMVAMTKMNEQSSRSHAIFTITSTVTKKLTEPDHPPTNSGGGGKTATGDGEDVYTVVSKINLIDLAGSENAISAGSTGDRLKEGAAINKSLLTLGRVIKVLAENSIQKSHQKHVRRSTVGSTPIAGQRGGGLESTQLEEISTPSSKNERRGSLLGMNSPSGLALKRGNSQILGDRIDTPGGGGAKKLALIPYRDSVLTYLLKDSLGGNSKTTMIATIRPGESR
jgi:kinesin family member 1